MNDNGEVGRLGDLERGRGGMETRWRRKSAQIRRSSRSVCANTAEAWRKRRYPAAFVSKLSDAEAEAAETQVWLTFAVKCHYLDSDAARELYATYDHILGKLVTMIRHPEQWTL